MEIWNTGLRTEPTWKMIRLFARQEVQTFCRWALTRSARSRVALQDYGDSLTVSPSGWRPPTGSREGLPFRVVRTKTKNLPVYLDYKHGRKLVTTIVRKIEGDVLEMEQMLRDHLTSAGIPHTLVTARPVVVSTKQGKLSLRHFWSRVRLRKALPRGDLLTRVDEIAGSIKIHGNHRERVQTWLRSMGF